MMGKSSFITTLALLAMVLAANARVIIDPETDQETRCGGPLEADEGSLTFPGTGQITKPGEVCIWTIHLQTTSTFRLNFSSLDITGSDEECADGAVRLYSLTNLIPADRAESYTFCNNQPPTDGNFFLSENLLTIVYHSEEVPSEAGAGFTLNWQGIAVQPIPKVHESTYSSSPNGIIRYPIDGQYPPNQVNTWAVKGWDVDPNLRLHLTFPYVNLESCSKLPAEDCLCDALILYEINNRGVLSENRRLCGNVSDVDILGLGANFILGFFTDHEDEGELGAGFEVIYRPEAEPTTTPPPTTTSSSPPTSTSSPPTSTTPSPPIGNVSTTCGGTIFATEGTIEYKLGERYTNLERCVWTVRTPLLKQIRFTMNEIGVESAYDSVIVQALNSDGLGDRHMFTSGSGNIPIAIVNGSVALVIFHTDHTVVGTGFSLSFKAEGNYDGSYIYHEDIFANTTEVSEGHVKYPYEGVYRNLELSTFVFARPTNSHTLNVGLYLTSIDLEMDADGICKDVLRVFYMRTGASPILTETPEEGVCQTSQVSPAQIRADVIIVLLTTDQQGRSNGFLVEWELINRRRLGLA